MPVSVKSDKIVRSVQHFFMYGAATFVTFFIVFETVQYNQKSTRPNHFGNLVLGMDLFGLFYVISSTVLLLVCADQFCSPSRLHWLWCEEYC